MNSFLDKNLEKDINLLLSKEAKRLGKKVSWFVFAKKTKTGAWRLLVNKTVQFKILEKITDKLSLKYVHKTKGQIVDMISEVVNKASVR